MKNLLLRLKLVDEHDGNISWTTVALVVLIVKLAMLQSYGMPDLAAFFLALASYNYKKYLNQGAGTENPVNSSELEQKVADMQSKINGLLVKVGIQGFGK